MKAVGVGGVLLVGLWLVVHVESGEVDLQGFRQALLECTNGYRAKHQAPPLTEDPQLDQAAQEWAQNISSRNVMQHSGEPGENIFVGGGDEPDMACRAWYTESYWYNYDDPENNPNAQHFTQLVWKSSTSVGFGIASNENDDYFVVARFLPSGNWPDQFADNVLPEP